MHADLVTMLEAVQILGPRRYSVLNEVHDIEVNDHSGGHFNKNGGARSPLVAALEVDLYSRLYVMPNSVGTSMPDPLAQRDLVNALSAANSGRGGWDEGWTLASVTGADEHITVSKDGVAFRVGPESIRTRRTLRTGDSCRVRIGKEYRNLLPNYYVVIGDADPGPSAHRRDPAIRLYWHLTSECAAEFVGALTTELNAAEIPFRAKVLSSPHAYFRADAGVLYLEPRWFRRATPQVSRLYRQVAHNLRPTTPMFTKRLAPGLALAEDPSNGLSFGQHRCHLVALASYSAFSKGKMTLEARALELGAAMRKAGVNPMRPHLAANSRDFHRLAIALADKPGVPNRFQPQPS